MVFSQIRKTFGVDRTDFVESLCGNSNFIEFMSNSNSGEVS
jgi:1-phosphatidylinositol-4-phosphate 5-kinase